LLRRRKVIDRFSKKTFETKLPFLANCGFDSEELYRLAIDEKSEIIVRSSIGKSGYADETGEDSIRLWIQDSATKKPISGKASGVYITRVSGWDIRLESAVRTLLIWRKRAGNCPKCHQPKSIGKVGKDKGANAGRPFAKCWNDNIGFVWLDNDLAASELEWTDKILGTVQESSNSDIKTIATIQKTEKIVENAVFSVETIFGNEILIESNGSDEPKEIKTQTANDEQLSAISKPVNVSIRVLAPPGSGKTFAMVHRIKFLVNNGISPDNILAVTFGKEPSREMLEKVVKIVPEFGSGNAGNQICTIHAACNRILKSEGDKRTLPKDWQVKKILRGITENLWFDEDNRPGPFEVLAMVNQAKYLCLTSRDDGNYFVQTLGEYHGKRMDRARAEFDALMSKEGFMTFADMIYDVEQRLINDGAFRAKWQSRFTHVIVDEAQDVNAQALRILITLSLEPGKNDVYNNWKSI